MVRQSASNANSESTPRNHDASPVVLLSLSAHDESLSGLFQMPDPVRRDRVQRPGTDHLSVRRELPQFGDSKPSCERPYTSVVHPLGQSRTSIIPRATSDS
ncbi:hypothetical protein HSR122_1243 [Halapricum desulfuricans]|uniref:Uncharacterized protein n=1 Tax=Halapricum desulfuricans TaxID=2841257 RepID=A0A897N868_9EURY|nr:hypothetical protein HSR122_1243 [Halapricum desulfuricans]